MNLKTLEWIAIAFFSITLIARFVPFSLFSWLALTLCGALLLVTLWTIVEVFDKKDIKNTCLSAIWMLDNIEGEDRE